MKKGKTFRVFISHSSVDKPFAEFVASSLRRSTLVPWLDKGEVIVGDDVIEKLGEGLRTMDFLVFIVSKNALLSRWVDRELKFAARREIEERRVLILPFIIDSTPSGDLPWYIQHLRSQRVTPDQQGAVAVVESITKRTSGRLVLSQGDAFAATMVERDPAVDRIIVGVGLGQWKVATAAALEILRETNPAGRNELFDILLGYQNLPEDDEMLWPALHTIEMCADLAPDLMDRAALFGMAGHSNFTVRSSAASICMNWAQFAPDRVPIDVVLRLSVYDEDWYVQAPANAALKSMVRAVPGVLAIFYLRLRSVDADERAHSASCLFDIAEKEPDLLDYEDLVRAAAELREVGDRNALGYVTRSATRVKLGEPRGRYKYGL